MSGFEKGQVDGLRSTVVDGHVEIVDEDGIFAGYDPTPEQIVAAARAAGLDASAIVELTRATDEYHQEIFGQAANVLVRHFGDFPTLPGEVKEPKDAILRNYLSFGAIAVDEAANVRRYAHTIIENSDRGEPRESEVPAVVISRGQHGETIMLFGGTNGNLGSRVWDNIHNALSEQEGLSQAEAVRLAEVAARAGTTAVAETLDGQVSFRVELHTRNGSGSDRPVQVFTVQRKD